MRSHFETLIEEAFRSPFAFLNDERPIARADQYRSPRYDVDESEDGFTVQIEVPGVRKEDIQMELNENVLTITGERKGKNGASGLKFRKAFTLPPTVDQEKISASVEDGILHIALPKAEKAKPRLIEIQSAH